MWLLSSEPRVPAGCEVLALVCADRVATIEAHDRKRRELSERCLLSAASHPLATLVSFPLLDLDVEGAAKSLLVLPQAESCFDPCRSVPHLAVSGEMTKRAEGSAAERFAELCGEFLARDDHLGACGEISFRKSVVLGGEVELIELVICRLAPGGKLLLAPRCLFP